MVPWELGDALSSEVEEVPYEEAPNIVWGGSSERMTCFPSRWQLEQRCKSRADQAIAEPLDDFVQAVASARKEIWILDPHFDEVGIYCLRIGLDQCSRLGDLRIRIIGSSMKCSANERRKNVTEGMSKAKLPDVCWEIVPDSRSYPFAHDRFCIIDRQLIHFGGTVGGGTAQLTAASIGWCARKRGAIDFFVELWELVHHG